MKYFNFKRNKSYFDFLKSYLFIIFIPLLIGAFGFVGIGNTTRSQAISINNAMVEQFSKAIDQNTLEIENLSNVILSNSRILKYRSVSEKTGITLYELSEIQRDLINYNISLSSVNDYFIYFPNSNIITTKTSSYSPELFYNNYCYLENGDYETFYNEFLNGVYTGNFVNRKVISCYNPKSQNLLYIKSIPNFNGTKTTVNLFILFDVKKISGVFNTYMDIRTGSSAAIVSPDSSLLYNLGNKINHIDYIKAIEKYEKDKVTIFDGNIVSLQESSGPYGWKYIIFTPESYVMAPVDRIRNITLFVLLLYLIMSVSVSYFLSRKNYEPIKSLLSTVKKNVHMLPNDLDFDNDGYKIGLKKVEKSVINIAASNKIAADKISELLPIVRNNVLVALLNGTHVLKNQEDLNNTLQSYGIGLISQFFAVMIIDIHECLKTNSENMLVSMAVSEITKTISSSEYKCHVAELPNNNFCIVINILNIENADDLIASAAVTYIEQLKTQIINKVYIYTGCCMSGIDGIHQSMEQACKAMNYHAVMPDLPIIEYRKLQKPQYIMNLAEDIEKGLKVQLISGNVDEAVKLLDTIYEENFAKRVIDPQIAQCLVMRIFTIALSVSDSIGFELYEKLKKDNSELSFLQSGSTTRETQDALSSIFRLICNYVHENSHCRLTTIRNCIAEIIDKEIDNPNLNQAYIAESMNMSTPYLSYIFKEAFGVNMTDYIGKKRSEAAAELLSRSDLTLHEIASKIGFIDSAALIRVFKKYYGVTPGQYRKAYN